MKKVYFISGTMCTIDLWQFIFPKLNNIIPVFIDITPATSFEDINNIILSKIEESAIIVGFSLGGFSAMNFAIHHPNKIKKLVVIAANASGLNAKEIELRKSTIAFLEKHKYKGISKARIQQFLHPDNYQNEKITSIIIEMDQTLGKNVLINQLKSTSLRFSISDALLKSTIPIVFISAQNDTLIPLKQVKEFAKKTLKGKHITIKNCGHMIPLEKPNELSEIINML